MTEYRVIKFSITVSIQVITLSRWFQDNDDSDIATKSISWVKTKSLLMQHKKSDRHIAAIERMVMSQSTEEHGNVMKQLGAATAEEKKQNRDITKKLI